MPRPVGVRTAVSYKRDVESLNRLRVAIKIDKRVNQVITNKAVQEIDMLIETLIQLINEVEK